MRAKLIKLRDEMRARFNETVEAADSYRPLHLNNTRMLDAYSNRAQGQHDMLTQLEAFIETQDAIDGWR